MKTNNFKLILVLLTTLTIVSCDPDKVDDDFFNSVPYYGQFNSKTSTLFTEENAENIFNGKVKLTDTRDIPVKYGIMVAEDSEAIEGTDFELLSNEVIIEAGKIEGEYQIQANFENATLDGKVAKFNLVDLNENDNNLIQGNIISEINIVKSCPLEEDFTGDYTINQTTPPYASATVPIFEGQVTLEVGSNQFERVFNAKFYPALGFQNPEVPVVFELVCNEVNMLGELEASGVGCGGSISIGLTEENPAIYDETDDSQIEIKFFEDVTNNCAEGTETTIVLNKVN